jgi:hypothetical protein
MTPLLLPWYPFVPNTPKHLLSTAWKFPTPIERMTPYVCGFDTCKACLFSSLALFFGPDSEVDLWQSE